MLWKNLFKIKIMSCMPRDRWAASSLHSGKHIHKPFNIHSQAFYIDFTKIYHGKINKNILNFSGDYFTSYCRYLLL